MAQIDVPCPVDIDRFDEVAVEIDLESVVEDGAYIHRIISGRIA